MGDYKWTKHELILSNKNKQGTKNEQKYLEELKIEMKN